MNPVVSGLSEVVNFGGASILLTIQQLLQFPAIPVDVSQVQRPEVLVEWCVTELIVNVEKESILDVLRGLSVGNPIQFVYTIIVKFGSSNGKK